MAIMQTTHVREVLLVKPSPDAPWAGHQKRITITAGAPVPIPDVYGDAEPLDVADLAEVLDPMVIELLAERDAAVAARAAVEQLLQVKVDEIAAQAATIAGLTAQVEALQAQIDAAEPGA